MPDFYITTAIDYVNGSPHLGHAYEKVLTDVIARIRRMMGDRVYFLTGVDEHGQKVQQSARARGVEPQQFCDEIAQEFRALLPRLNVSNDDFIRTTEERHKKIVRELLQRLYDKGEIYKAEYRGYYSTRQEQFLQEKDRNPDGTWPAIFGEVTEITESNYFFKLSAYQDWLVQFLQENERFVFPKFRQKQVLEFLKEPLNDLCISRPKERLEWGIPLPFDEDFVTYVWFDALTNYYSAVADRDGVWPATWHVIGKDILVPPHAVYWPIMLRAAGIPLPKGIIAHGWWSINSDKMSKSTGNFIEPNAFVEKYGVDALRYFLLREMVVGQDSDFSEAQFLARYNADLANNLGNLLNRTLNMLNRFAEARVPAVAVVAGAESAAGAQGKAGSSDPASTASDAAASPEAELRTQWEQTREAIPALWEGFQFHIGLERTIHFVSATNAYIEKRAPWKLGKSGEPADRVLLDTTLATMAEALRLASVLLRPFIPESVARIEAALGYAPSGDFAQQCEWGSRLTGAQVAEALVLFPRVQAAAPAAANAANAGVRPPKSA
ncbi:methionine--tRNA ligase [Cephaloticoccus primus]|uniref:Methionine--tRNA ligase n=1 Tax=Cephaloticoccus primus TaxID=1548207 RepID=A0A139SPL3_9BACT|nr:class I tRNA ligase family protein [Cephaloticoccus primus]KXU36518.1 methionine--tRNA ligase [Cephaloticoccus primus]